MLKVKMRSSKLLVTVLVLCYAVIDCGQVNYKLTVKQL